ncbi:MAG: lysophospholipid acyltransferase family protein [Candidatus Acidiferrales bacterium]|jgi:1-acyl-sn-glycerol-3-phosphate acyltransferase
MKNAWLVVRSAMLWAVSGIHFVVVIPLLIGMAGFIDPRKNDYPQRLFFRNILRLLGIRFQVRRAAGFDPHRTSLFICNHVNIFDPFVVYTAIPQFLRGFELASHFRIPFYGWLMGRFGNIPVPDDINRAGVEIMKQRASAALESGISLIAFPEGRRTRDGHVGLFRKGIFRMAQDFAVPLVPVSMVGSFEVFRTGHWMLHPGTITVYLHDTIEFTEFQHMDTDELRTKIHGIVSAPIEAAGKEKREEVGTQQAEI